MTRWDPAAVAKGARRILVYAKVVRIEHTLFSLPFATIGLIAAGCRNLLTYLLAFTSLAGLRIAALAFNNLADVDVDAMNPRTSSRPLVRGMVSPREVLLIMLVGLLVYVASAYAIGWQAALLSPIPAVLALAYPYAKRVHHAPHVHLGAVLGLSVWGGWVAGIISDNPYVALPRLILEAPWLVAAGVALWVSGFDVVYSCMDEEFDRRMGLGSLPALLGSKRALYVALAMETIATVSWFYGSLGVSIYAALSSFVAGCVAIYSVILALRDYSNIPKAFNLNLGVGFIALTGYALTLLGL